LAGKNRFFFKKNLTFSRSHGICLETGSNTDNLKLNAMETKWSNLNGEQNVRAENAQPISMI
jgi:hypothetical protein